MTTPVWNLDSSPDDADWIKGGTWDLPPYGSPEFLAAIGGESELEAFKKTRAYLSAIDQGLIHDDEWVADWCEVPHQAEGDDDDA